MLALDIRRQPNHFSPAFQLQHPQPQPPQSHPQYLDTLSYYQSLNASDISSPSSSHNSIDSTTLNLPVKSSLGFLDTQNLVSSPPSEVTNPSQYMTEHYGFHSPTIRIEQSSPALGSQLPQSFTDSSPYTNWSDYSDEMAVSRSLHAAAFQRKRAAHQRAQSASSSMVSNPSASPFVQGSAPYGYTVNNATLAAKMGQNFTTQDQPSSAFSNHLPTPTQTPTHESFLTTGYPSAYSQGGDMTSVMAAHLAMHNNIETHSNPEDEIPGMSHSGRQSVSSMGQDPSTPRTIPENYDDGFKVPAHDQQMRFPKLDRTVSDAYNDALFGAAAAAANSQTSAPKTSSGHHLSPHRNMINEYLQAAQMARSQSPTSTASRGVSPFRPGSPYVQSAFGQMQRPFTAASVRQAQQARASQMELSQHVSQQQDEQPKTISPKDAVLEYNETEEDAKMPLFSEGEASAYGQQFGSQQNFSAGAQNMVNSLNASRAGGWSNELQHRPSRVATTNAASFNFSAPAMAGYSQTALPFGSHNNYRAHPVSTKHEDTPEFPAHLTSMDSSASEAPSIAASNHHHHHHHHSESSKPVSSTADSGTYTCTYHGCNLRFETPQKLQKHKRESHRTPAAGTQITPGIGSGMTSAQLAARNSQAGPHKCERINPTTGKPCNAIFSRPYDLTRHEDTIHNARKQKVRCALCVEEKTFSRNDALTRHMRVVHPEVDFPGKHRRRGAHE